MTIRAAASALLAVVLHAGVPLEAQELETTQNWSAAVYYDAQQVARSGGNAYWHTLTAGVQRIHRAGSVAVQGVIARRFDIDDQALVVDAYQNLWNQAYSNLFFRYGIDAEVLPSFDAGGELFQTLGRVELGTSYRYQEIASSEVDTVGLGVAYYLGRWYLRPRVLVSNVHNSWAPFFSATARRYLGQSTDSSIDFALGFGEEVLEIAPPMGANNPVDVISSGSRFGSIQTQQFFGARLGAAVGATFSDYSEIEDRWGVSFGLITRW